MPAMKTLYPPKALHQTIFAGTISFGALKRFNRKEPFPLIFTKSKIIYDGPLNIFQTIFFIQPEKYFNFVTAKGNGVFPTQPLTS